MFKIRIYNNIDVNLDRERYNCGNEAQLPDPDLILVRSEKLHGKILPPDLLAIVRAGAGIDDIPVEECTQRGIVVFNTPGANVHSVKELAVWALIEAARNLQAAMQWLNKQEKEILLKLEAEKNLQA